jgi:hypothetical protein
MKFGPARIRTWDLGREYESPETVWSTILTEVTAVGWSGECRVRGAFDSTASQSMSGFGSAPSLDGSD